MDGKQIKHITPEGITYLDDEGNEQFIDFTECYANYVKKKTSPEHWEWMKQHNNWTDADWEHYLKRIENWKEVAVRNIIGNPAYIKFHSNPQIYFAFATEQEFVDMYISIGRVGWRTFDLS
jgi:hypothetical protein